jgi:hypothetical protein
MQDDPLIRLRERLEDVAETPVLVALGRELRLPAAITCKDVSPSILTTSSKLARPAATSVRPGARGNPSGPDTAAGPHVRSTRTTCSRLATSARAIEIASAVASTLADAPATRSARGAPPLPEARMWLSTASSDFSTGPTLSLSVFDATAFPLRTESLAASAAAVSLWLR